MAKKAAAKKGATAAGTAAEPGSEAAPAARKAPATRKAAPVLGLADLGDHIAATFDLPKSHARIYLDEAVALIGRQLKKGGKVRLRGLGTFQVKKRAARKGRNPATGASIKIKAAKRVAFAASRDLKAKL